MEKGQGKGTDTLPRDNDYLRRGDVKRLLENVVCLHEELPAQIDLIPAADVVPVRHGRWVWDNTDEDMHYYCSCCFHAAYGCTGEILSGKYHYCPNCGARMDMVTDSNQVKDGDGE